MTVCRKVPANFREEAIKWWTGRTAVEIDTYWNEFLAKFRPAIPEVPDTRAIMAYRVLKDRKLSGSAS